MKTTLEIPKITLEKAKSMANAQGISVQQLFVDAIEEKVRKTKISGSGEPVWMKLAGAFGKTRSARAETRRIQNVIDKEFEQVEPEDRE
jgi:hypothetical protein